MDNLIKINLFIHGLRGVIQKNMNKKKLGCNKKFLNSYYSKKLFQIGVETAKNLILAGPKSVVIYDE